MEKEMQRRLSEPILTSSHVRLTEFPIYGEFLNPGIYFKRNFCVLLVFLIEKCKDHLTNKKLQE